MRKGLLTLVCAGCALAASLLTPGLALASPDPLTISTAATSTGASGCTFTATAADQNVNVGAIQTCLDAGTSVTVTDPTGDGEEIEVESPIAATPCNDPGTQLTLEEQDGPVVLGADVTLSPDCSLAEESDGVSEGSNTITALELTLDSSGAVTLNGGNDVAMLEGNVVGDLLFNSTAALSAGGLTDPGGNVTLTGAGITVDGGLSAGGTVSLDATGTGKTISEDSGNVVAPELNASSTGNTTLTAAGNDVATFEGTAGGTMNFADDSSSGLTLEGSVGPSGVTVTNTGGINSTAQVNAATSDASLMSTNGSVIANTGVLAAELTVSGTSVSLTGADFVNTLNATASAGDVSANLYEAAATLDNVEATGGTVTVTNSDGSLDPAGTISGQSIALSADGFTASGGSLSAPSIAITDSDTSDAWTATPTSITANTAVLPYSGASNLSIGGGAKTFNVTPSTSTAMSFNGGSPAAGTLNYNPDGGTVSGTTSPPSGTIDNSKFEPVVFSGMSAVNVTDAATPPSTGTGTSTGSTGSGSSSGTPTTTTTTPSPNALTCTLRASSSKVTLPKSVHGKLKGKATLTLIANCTGAVHTTLNGAFTVTVKPAHKKAKSKTYGLKTIKPTLSAGVSIRIVLDVPSAVVKALATKGDKLSARFTLADSDNHDDVLKTTAITRLT